MEKRERLRDLKKTSQGRPNRDVIWGKAARYVEGGKGNQNAGGGPMRMWLATNACPSKKHPASTVHVTASGLGFLGFPIPIVPKKAGEKKSPAPRRKGKSEGHWGGGKRRVLRRIKIPPSDT